MTNRPSLSPDLPPAADDAASRDALFAAAYPELRRLAHQRLYRDGGRNTWLGTTALVHECYLRLAKVGASYPQDRRPFFAYASQTMRSVITDAARRRLAECRDRRAEVTLDDDRIAAPAEADAETILALHEALEQLARVRPRAAQAIEMRYFVGMDAQDIAEALDIGTRTVRRDVEIGERLLGVLLGRPPGALADAVDDRSPSPGA